MVPTETEAASHLRTPSRRRSGVRVLYFIPRSSPEIYGGNRSLLTAILGLREVSPLVVIGGVVPNDPIVDELLGAGIPHVILPTPPNLVGTRAPGWSSVLRKVGSVLRCNYHVAALIRDFRPEIVHVDAEAVWAVALATTWRRRRLLHHVRGVQNSRSVRPLRQVALALADQNLFVSESLREFYLAGTSRWTRRRVEARSTTVYNPIPVVALAQAAASTGRERVREALGIGSEECAIVLIGGLFAAKGQLRFLQEVASVVAAAEPTTRFYLVGGVKDPSYAGRCEAAVEAMQLGDRVRFVGYQSDVRRWYVAADVIAFPSAREGFGRVVAEAQAAGVPVVGSNIVGVRDALSHGNGGYLADDPESFANYLLRLVRQPDLRRQMGTRGREFAHRFSAERVTRDLEAVYRRLIGRG